MKPKDEMEILVVSPENYDRIIELSGTTREGAYSVEELEDMRVKAMAVNHVVTIAFRTLSRRYVSTSRSVGVKE